MKEEINMYRLNRRYVTYSLLSVAVMLCAGCDWFTKKETTTNAMPRMVLLDVNDDRIYADAHITGATHMPYDKIDTLDKASENWDKNKLAVVYCTNYMCLASKDVAKKLKTLGFNDVRVYSGGIAEWHQLHQKDAGYALEGSQQEAYLKKELTPTTPDDKNIVIITAQDLRKHMEEAGLLPK